jgi:hypothetical protein
MVRGLVGWELCIRESYVAVEADRMRIALIGFRRVRADHRFVMRMRQAGELIERGMARVGWRGNGSSLRP